MVEGLPSDGKENSKEKDAKLNQSSQSIEVGDDESQSDSDSDSDSDSAKSDLGNVDIRLEEEKKDDDFDKDQVEWYFESYNHKFVKSRIDSAVFWWGQVSASIFWAIYLGIKIMGLDFFWVTFLDL